MIKFLIKHLARLNPYAVTKTKKRPQSMTTSISPSTQYTLDIEYGGSWASKGTVRNKDGAILFEVPRNYSAFPYLWIDSHPNGHSYLICGSNYQGQTVLELDTGVRKDHLSDGSDQGFGFCWAQYQFDECSQVLAVGGCYWACPYEYRFYDFSDPMNGWPEIALTENELSVSAEISYIRDDEKWPEFLPDGRVRCFQTSSDDDDETVESEVVSHLTFKREGLTLLLQEVWVADDEAVKRKKGKEARAKYEQKMKTFREEDPLYLKYVELLKTTPNIKPQDYQSVGVTYEGWCPEPLNESRMCHRLHYVKGRLSIDLEWAIDTGPIKLLIFRSSVKDEMFFEHSPKGMSEAFAQASKEVLSHG